MCVLIQGIPILFFFNFEHTNLMWQFSVYNTPFVSTNVRAPKVVKEITNFLRVFKGFHIFVQLSAVSSPYMCVCEMVRKEEGG